MDSKSVYLKRHGHYWKKSKFLSRVVCPATASALEVEAFFVTFI